MSDTRTFKAGVVSGTLASVANGNPALVEGHFVAKFVPSSLVGTIQLQRSDDGGVSYQVASLDTTGTPAQWTDPANPITIGGFEPTIGGALWRWVMTVRTSGSGTYKLGN